MQNLSVTGELDLTNLVYISKSAHEGLLKRSQIKEHDLLIKITGVGRMAIASVVPEGFVGNINQHVVVIRTGSKEVSENLASFLNLDLAEKIATKRVTGGTRPALDYSALFSIPVINNREIYLKIKKAVTSKKEKEAEAQRLLEGIDGYLLRELGIELPAKEENNVQKRVFQRPFREVIGNRFDPDPYRTERLNAIANIKAGFYTAKPLYQVANFRSNKVNSIDEETLYIGLENIESNTGEWMPSEKLKDSISSASIFGKGDILFPKLRPYLNKVFHSHLEGLCSTEFHVLYSVSENNEFLANFLRSNIVVAQTKYLMSGNTLPRLQFNNIQKLLIPVPPLDKQNEIVNHIVAMRARANQLRQEAEAELAQAKQAVEAMILGQ